jgi:hypothetical protein
MHKKLFLIFAFVFFLNFPQSLFASILINQVQIETETNKDDEYIELYNNGNTEVDLTNFSLYKKTSGGTESSIVSKSRFENKKIPALGVLFLAREGGYTGNKTVDIYWPNSYSLASNNSLTLYKDFENKVIEDTVTWGEVKVFTRTTNTNNDTNNNTGNNTTENTNTNTSTSGSGSGLSSSSQTFIKKNPELKILAKNFGFVGMPIDFESIILNEEYRNIYGKYFWNFGDGETKELTSLENIPLPTKTKRLSLISSL